MNNCDNDNTNYVIIQDFIDDDDEGIYIYVTQFWKMGLMAAKMTIELW